MALTDDATHKLRMWLNYQHSSEKVCYAILPASIGNNYFMSLSVLHVLSLFAGKRKCTVMGISTFQWIDNEQRGWQTSL